MLWTKKFLRNQSTWIYQWSWMSALFFCRMPNFTIKKTHLSPGKVRRNHNVVFTILHVWPRATVWFRECGRSILPGQCFGINKLESLSRGRKYELCFAFMKIWDGRGSQESVGNHILENQKNILHGDHVSFNDGKFRLRVGLNLCESSILLWARIKESTVWSDRHEMTFWAFL